MTKSKLIVGIICVGFAVPGSAVPALAQSAQDSLVVYAKAGRVNQLTGTAAVRHSKTDPVLALAVNDELANGDLVATGVNTRLEVLLSPGTYLRLADNAEIQMISTDLEDVRLILRHGSAVIEVGNGPDEIFKVQIAMPSGTAVIEKRGLYRLNVEGKRSELLVMDGGTVLQPAMIKVGESKRVAVTSGVAEPVTKFDKMTIRDSLDSWSQERADHLAKANRSLDQVELSRVIRNAGGFSGRTGGYWVQSGLLGYSVFVPLDLGRWNSPYGVAYTIGGGGGWAVNNNPVARGTGGSPAPAVTPAGSAKGGLNPTGVRVP
ncbi:MAG: FecR family protein [Pyrinomonadaceae bacterium]